MTSRDPEVGDIWLAYVEFSDRPGIGKVRPVVVVDVLVDGLVERLDDQHVTRGQVGVTLAGNRGDTDLPSVARRLA